MAAADSWLLIENCGIGHGLNESNPCPNDAAALWFPRSLVNQRRSAETPGDVVLGLLVLGLDEDLIGNAVLDHLAQIHIGREV